MGGESSKSEVSGGKTKSADPINAVFVANATRSVGEQKMITRDDFVKLFDDCQEIGELMYKHICHCQQRSSVVTGLNATDFVAGVRHAIDLGGESSLMDYYISVFSSGSTLKQNDILKILRLCCDADWATITGRKSSDKDPVFVLLAQNALGANNQTISSVRFRNWCINNCATLFDGFHNIVLSHLASKCEASATGMSGVNSLVANCQSKHSVVSVTWLWFLTVLLGAQLIPTVSDICSAATMSRLMKVTGEGGWHVVYNSASQGLSVNRFEYHVMDYKGPTLLFISFQDFVFLLAVDCPWKESQHKWGSDNSMLVQLTPEYKIRQSGSGLIYFNTSGRTFVKGLSVGRDQTILSIDGELEKVNYLGAHYGLHTLEVWGCGGTTAQECQQRQKSWEKRAVTKEQNRKLSVEDWRDNTDRELLEMGGVQTRHDDRQQI